MDFTAKLIEIRAPVTGQGKNGEWKRQEYIFETESQYPRKICVQVWVDSDITDPSIMQVGNLLNVAFDLESREFNNRWYTDVRAWRITLPGAQPAGGMSASAPNFAPQAAAAPAAAPRPASAPQAPAFPDNGIPAAGGEDDLPF